MGMATPLGYLIIPKLAEEKYQQMNEKIWSNYRLNNKYKLNRTDFDSMLEEMYEQKKDTWIQKEQDRDFGTHHEERFKLGVWLGEQKQFIEIDHKAKQRILARQIFRDLTEGEIDEVVETARMGLKLADIEKMKQKHTKDARKEDETLEEEERAEIVAKAEQTTENTEKVSENDEQAPDETEKQS